MTSGNARRKEPDEATAPIVLPPGPTDSDPPNPDPDPANPDPAGPADAPGAAQSAELDRLHAEVAALRGQLATREHRRRQGFVVRRFIAAVLVAVAGFGAVGATIGIWGARTTLSTDNWVATVDELPAQPAVTAAMSAYLTDELFRVLDVRQRLAEALPPKAAFLAGPVTNTVHDYVRDRVYRFMRSDDFRSLWESANRFAHAQIMAILENRSETVSVAGSTVTLNLLPVINNLLVTIEDSLPALFGKRLDLPAITSGVVPPGLRERIEGALEVTLPSDFAQIKLYNRHRLGRLQAALVTFKRSVVLLVVGAVLAFGLALWVSPNRRRTVLQLGVWLVIAVFVLSYVIRAVRDQLLAMVPNGVYRNGASVAVYEVFTTLRQWGDWILWTGVAVAVLAYLVGPGHVPVALRRRVVRGALAAVRGARTIATGPGLRTWSARYVDVLRAGGVAVAAITALLFSSWTALFTIVVLLAGYEVLVTFLARWGAAAAPAQIGATGHPGATGRGGSVDPGGPTVASAGVRAGRS